MLRKMRKQVQRVLIDRDFTHEPGERVVDVFSGKVYDLKVSNGRNKHEMGELTPALARPQKKGAKAVKIDGVWYWEYKTRKANQ